MNSDQRVKAERAWLAAATAWARAHADADADAVIAAVPNPHNLLVRPLAGAAVTVAGWDRETETRKTKFLAAHPQVKIWFDAGGWHARWRTDDDNYTGISHPSELGGLLDMFEARDQAVQ